MTHTGSPERVTFDLYTVEITEKATAQITAKGIANHSTKDYEFSHYLLVSPLTTLLYHANNTNKIWSSQFQISKATPK